MPRRISWDAFNQLILLFTKYLILGREPINWDGCAPRELPRSGRKRPSFAYRGISQKCQELPSDCLI